MLHKCSADTESHGSIVVVSMHLDYCTFRGQAPIWQYTGHEPTTQQQVIFATEKGHTPVAQTKG